MSEESDRVWRSLRGELRKVRRRRAAIRGAALAAVVLFGLGFIQRAHRPYGEAPELVGEMPAEPQVAEAIVPESPLLAVLVYDGEAMRFELMDGEQLAGSEMELSLQPVVMDAGSGFW